MKQLKLQVIQREKSGSSDSGRLRRDGKIPAVVYGKTGTQHIIVDEPEFRKMMRAAAGSASLIQVTDDKGNTKLTLIQEIQRDSVTDKFLHVDFHEVAANEPMHASIPVHVIGEPYGVKNENGILEVPLHMLEIRCLPKDLPEYVEINVAELRVGEAVHIKDLPELAGVTYLGEPEAVVTSCSEARKVTEEEEAAEAEAAEEAAAEEEAEEEAKEEAPSA